MKYPPALLLLMVACTYEPEEIYFREVPQPENTATISLNSYNDSDTIVLYGPANFSFQVDISPGTVQQVEVLLGDNLIMTSGSKTNNFSIDGYRLVTGVHELKIQFISNSGSGSFADEVGAERIQAWRKWIVKIDVDPPPKPVFTVSEENGFLKLSWTAYNKPNFDRYQLIAQLEGESSRSIAIHDAAQTTWTDSTYIGGKRATYSIYTHARGNSAASLSVEHVFSLAVEYRGADSTATIRWAKARFPGALKNYEVFENGQVVQTVTGPNDTITTVKINALWNMSTAISVRYNPAYSTHSSLLKHIITNTVSLPRLRIDPSDDLYYNSTLGSLVGYRSSYLVLFNEALQPTDSFPAAFQHAVPYSGPYVYFAQGGSIVQYNVLTGESNAHETLNASGSRISAANLQASSNGILSYYYLQSGWHSRVYDFVSDTYLEKQYFSFTYSFVNPLVSNEGEYLYSWNNAQVKRLNGGMIELVGVLGYNANGFRPDNGNEIILDGDIYSASTLTMIRDLPVPPSYYFYSYDPVSKYLLYVKSGTAGLYAIHIDNLDVKVIQAYPGKRYTLMGGYVFDEDGYYIKVF